MITLQQAIYGEKSGYSLLKASDEKSDLPLRISGYTDLADRPEEGVLSNPIIRGFFAEANFLLIKTFPDISPGMRSGRVFSHALIIDPESLQKIKNICDLFQYHLIAIDKNALMEPIEYANSIVESHFPPPNGRERAAINALLNHEDHANCIAWLDKEEYWEWIARLWSQLPIKVKTIIRIGAAFNPQYVNESMLNLVYIPSKSKISWTRHAFKIIDFNENEKLLSSAAQWIAGEVTKDSIIHMLLVDFELNIETIVDLNRLQDLGKVYTILNEKSKLNELLVFSNYISSTIPNPSKGKTGKTKLLNAILKSIPTANAQMIIALKYQSWKGFENAITQVSDSLKSWLASNLYLAGDSMEKYKIIKEALANQKTSNWWKKVVKNYLINSLREWKDSYAFFVWDWISKDSDLISLLEPALPQDAEASLLKKIPKLERTVGELVLEIAQRKNWFNLHGLLAIRLYSPSVAISKQISVDNDLNHFEAIKKMSDELPCKEFIEITISFKDKRLYIISGQLIKKQPKLLREIVIENIQWQQLWLEAVNEGTDLWNGISNPIKTLHSLLDQVLTGTEYNEKLLSAIAESNFNDLVDYPKRVNIWERLPKTCYLNFLKSTSKSVLNKFLSGSIGFKEIEKPISDRITSDEFMCDFLSENRDNINSVLLVYESFPSLKDKYLADYITYYRSELSSSTSKRLGNLISNNLFKLSARSIYNKTSYNQSFALAYDRCKELVDLGFFEKMFGSSKSSSLKTDESKMMQKDNKLPTVVVLTAVKLEYLAVKKHLEKDISEINVEGTMYEGGTFNYLGQKVANVIIRECGQKNPIAAQETQRAISVFNPDYIFFVGISGSRKPQDFGIGDVIFPEKVYDYESGKSYHKSFKARTDSVSPSYDLLEIAKIERFKVNWQILLKGNYKKAPKADIGVIASGEKLIEHYDSAVGKIITDHCNDASVVEMEGYGFMNTASRQGKKHNDMQYAVIRGISDILEQTALATNLLESNRRPDDAKEFAADSAAAFAFWLIFKVTR